MIKFIGNKLLAAIYSFGFRIRHAIFTGKIRSDFRAINQCRFGKFVKIKGSVYVSDSALVFGDCSSVASTAIVGAEKGGVINIHDRVIIGPRSSISTTSGTITIGEGTTFFSDCRVSGFVTIGLSCLFANNVTILSTTHDIYGEGTIRENDRAFFLKHGGPKLDPILIADDCWLGSNVVVLPGVHLHKGCVVGANAVVTKSFPEYSIIAGVPAQKIGSRK